MTEHDLALFNDSLECCTARSGFLDRFYDLFVASSKAVAEKFSRTDFRKQKAVLKASLYKTLFAAQGKAEGHGHLQRIAMLHSRNELDIRPHLYDLWLDCLLQAVREYDPLFTHETERVWRRMMEPGIEFMQSQYWLQNSRAAGTEPVEEASHELAQGRDTQIAHQDLKVLARHTIVSTSDSVSVGATQLACRS